MCQNYTCDFSVGYEGRAQVRNVTDLNTEVLLLSLMDSYENIVYGLFGSSDCLQDYLIMTGGFAFV
jgi:hypothetical protein